MRSGRTFVVLLAFALAWPSIAHACSCIASATAQRRDGDRPWIGRQAVFIGYVLEADQLVDSTQSGITITRLVRFVTEESWRGSLPDTVTLFVGADAPCAYYSKGYRYFVGADWDSQVPARLTTAPCDDSWWAREDPRGMDTRLRAEEGPPNWTAPPAGTRDLDKGARPFGTPISRSPTAQGIAFIPPSNTFAARFEMGDFSGVSGPIIYPEPGLYQVRVTWKDGSQFQGYVSIRCEHRSEGSSCLAARDFSALLPRHLRERWEREMNR